MIVDSPQLKNAVEYLAAIRDAQQTDQAFDAFAKLIEIMGFECYAYASNITVGQVGGSAGILANYMDPEYLSLYVQKNYIESDPVLEWCMAQKPPATWKTIAHELGKENFPIWQNAAKFNMVDGLAFWFQLDNDDTLGFMSLASAEPLPRHLFATGLKMAQYLCASIHFLKHGKPVPTGDVDPLLTIADRQLLNWINYGKSIQEIADKQGVTRQAINDRLKRVMKNMNTSRRHAPVTIVDWLGYY